MRQRLTPPPSRVVARINRSNPFARGLVAALPLNGLAYDAVTRAPVNYEGAPLFARSPGGEGLFTDGTDDGLWLSLPKTISVPVTLLCVYAIAADSDVFDNTAQNDYPLSLRDEASAFEVFALGIANTAGAVAKVSLNMLDDTSGSGVGQDGTTNLWTGFAGTDLTLAGVIASTTSLAVYLNGALEGTSTPSARDPNCTRLYVGHSSSSSAHTGFARGVTKCVLVWDRALSAVEIQQISANPWQVFETHRRRGAFRSAAPAGIVAASIPSAEAFGTPAIAAQVASAGIASAEAIGAPVVAARVAPNGIATAEAFGTPVVSASVAAAGIASAEAIGTPVVAAAIVAAGGIESEEAFGEPVVSAEGIVADSIPSAEALGAPVVAAAVVATAIASAEAFGEPIVGDVPEHPIECASIPSAEAFGLCTVGSQAAASQPNVGGGRRSSRRPRLRELPPVLLPPHAIRVASIPSAEAIGRPTVGAGIAPLSVVSPPSMVGAPRVRRIPTPMQLMDEMLWLR